MKVVLDHLEIELGNNGYTPQEIQRALCPKTTSSTSTEEQYIAKGRTYLPNIKNVTDRISKLNDKHSVNVIFKQQKLYNKT